MKHSHSNSHIHARPQSYKEDYRNILSQRTPEQQFALVKLITVLILMTVIVSYLFIKA